MNFFDIICLIVIGFCFIRGIFRGLIKEITAIVGVLGGFYGAYMFYPNVGIHLKQWISDVAYLNIISFLIIFCGVLIVVNMLGMIIKYLLNVAFMGWLDRIGGAGFGFAKGLLIVCVLFISLTAFLPKGDSLIKDSVLSPHVSEASEIMAAVISREMKTSFSDKIEELKTVWKKKH